MCSMGQYPNYDSVCFTGELSMGLSIDALASEEATK